MAERLVSPGVFTKENDLSFLPKGIAEIGAAFVGPTLKGPAFRPVIVESQGDFLRTFGATTPDLYTPYAVNKYLSEASRATVVRVLGLGGYDSAVNKSVVLRLSGSAGIAVVGVLHPSRLGVSIASSSVSGSPVNFTLTVSGANGLKTYTSMSVDPTSPNYFATVLGSDPSTKQDAYVYADFPAALTRITSASAILGVPTSTQLNFSGSVFGAYSNAVTPWIRSQQIGGIKYDLFRLWTLSDGNAANDDIKASVIGIRPSATVGEYGTFSLLIRKLTDTDSKMSVLEQYDNLTMDPNSPNYVARRIGTSRTIIDASGDVYLDGDFPNASKYVYVDMADGISAAPTTVLPYGFAPLKPSVASTAGVDVPAPAYVKTRYYTPAGATTSVADSKVYYGFNFSDRTSLSYLNPLPSGSATSLGVDITGVVDAGFDLLTSISGSDAADLVPTTATSLRKFSVPFQGGFDGMNPAAVLSTGGNITATNTQGFDLSDATKAGTKAYVQALAALANPDVWDINMLVLPGVIYSQHPYVVAQGISLCENRGDAFYVLDGDILGATIDNAINAVAGLDTSYAATYHPWVKVLDESSNKTVWVPPSVVMPGVYAFNDRVAAEWYAPAGLNRGGIGEALQVRTRLDTTARNNLYDGRVNPIATFPGQGIVAWGQKTLQHNASALDRINVRRLLITVKKFIASTSRYLVFEQNVEGTRNRFLSIVNPYLSTVAERNGLYAFKVVMDETNNTPDIIDRNMLVGELFLQPARAVEFIRLDFNILPTGAVFPQ
jgi:phage tail sheath protein FI